MLALAVGIAVAAPADRTPPEAPPDATEALRDDVRALRDELERERIERRRLLEELASARRQVGPHITADDGALVSYASGPRSHVRAGEEVEDVVAFGASIRVDGTVRGDATAFGGDVTIGPTGVVQGDAVSLGGRVILEDGARLRGDRVGLDTTTGFVDDRPPPPESWGHYLYRRTLFLLSLAGAGVLMVGLFPTRVASVADRIAESPISSGFLGAAFSSLTLVIGGLFALLTLGLGAPLSLVAFGVLAASWLLGFVAVCQAIGDRLPFEAPNGRWAALFTLSFVFAFSDLFGLGGTLFTLGVSLSAIGATLHARFGS